MRSTQWPVCLLLICYCFLSFEKTRSILEDNLGLFLTDLFPHHPQTKTIKLNWGGKKGWRFFNNQMFLRGQTKIGILWTFPTMAISYNFSRLLWYSINEFFCSCPHLQQDQPVLGQGGLKERDQASPAPVSIVTLVYTLICSFIHPFSTHITHLFQPRTWKTMHHICHSSRFGHFQSLHYLFYLHSSCSVFCKSLTFSRGMW